MNQTALDIAEEFDGEIINADSMQIYKEIKILSARPDKVKLNIIFMDLYLLKKNFQLVNGMS